MPRTVLALVMLLGVGIGFRLWATDHARFTGDESDYWAKSRQVAVGQFTPRYGPEITGSAARLPGPAYYYLMAIPQRIGASPRWGSRFVALGHGVAALLLFLLAYRARGPRAGLLALAVAAFAPWDVLYADRIWGSCVVPIFGTLALYASVRSRDSGFWQGFLLFVSIVLVQLHLSVPVLWGACLTILILRPPERWHKRALAIGLGLAIAAYLPYLLAEIASGFANTKAILAQGGGKEPWAIAALNPLKVIGYGVLYGTSEIGYHFARGYWGGGFDDGAYLTLAGWRAYFSRHGTGWATLGLLSIGVAFATWSISLIYTVKTVRRAIAERSRDLLSLEAVLHIALGVGFVGGGVLMMGAKKTFFPHYANILMPMALWPMVAGLDRAWTRPRWRPVLAPLLGLIMISMAANASRYYLEIDRLNGLGNTLDMVAHVLDDPDASQTRFQHFNNRYAWQMVARTLHGRNMPNGAEARYVVHNARVFEGEPPTGSQVFSGVRLQRIPPEGKAFTGSKARKDWRRWEVSAVHPDGRQVSCRPRLTQCQYGEQPWQHFGPELMTMGGKERPILFLHPIQGAVVRARYPLEAGITKGVLHYGLSDGATRSTNPTPVEITVRADDGTVLATAQAGNRPGLHDLPFTRTSTEAGGVTLEIRTDNEGARIFGFDLTLP